MGIDLSDWVVARETRKNNSPPIKLYVNKWGFDQAFEGSVDRAREFALYPVYYPITKYAKMRPIGDLADIHGIEIAKKLTLQTYFVGLAWGGEDGKTQSLDLVGFEVGANSGEKWKKNAELKYWNLNPEGILVLGGLCANGHQLIAAEDRLRRQTESLEEFMTKVVDLRNI